MDEKEKINKEEEQLISHKKRKRRRAGKTSLRFERGRMDPHEEERLDFDEETPYR
ncbi:MAG: hypothetical protein JXA82_10865 [Sedimentisphaerales bacterium]|nr:hypothetical protein [Sedimentisphaerales bacterium]